MGEAQTWPYHCTRPRNLQESGCTWQAGAAALGHGEPGKASEPPKGGSAQGRRGLGPWEVASGLHREGRGRECSLALQEAHGVWALCWTPSSWAALSTPSPWAQLSLQGASHGPTLATGLQLQAGWQEWSLKSGVWRLPEAPGKNLLRGARRAQDSSLRVAKKQQVKRTLLWATHIWAGGARCACRFRNTA